MTVATQMTSAIISVQSAAASMKTFSMETEDKKAKLTFDKLAATLDSAAETLQERQQYIEKQEPQYK